MTHAATDDRLFINGTWAPEFAAVKEAFSDNFRRRGEIGAAVCVYKDGKKVVDLWGGHKDLARTEPARPALRRGVGGPRLLGLRQRRRLRSA